MLSRQKCEVAEKGEDFAFFFAPDIPSKMTHKTQRCISKEQAVTLRCLEVKMGIFKERRHELRSLKYSDREFHAA